VTKTLKLDSCERIIVPAVIPPMIPSRIISQYVSYCKDHECQPGSECSLFRMLEVCSASMQKSLPGLQYITPEETEAFNSVLSMNKTLVENGGDLHWGQIIEQVIKRG